MTGTSQLLTLEQLCAALVAAAEEPDTLWCRHIGCMNEATHWVTTKRVPKREYCTECSHAVAEVKKTQGHEEVRRVPIK